MIIVLCLLTVGRGNVRLAISVLYVKALVWAFNQEKALIWASSTITNLRVDLRIKL